MKDCPVCHNFQPKREGNIVRDSDGRVWSVRDRRKIPTNAGGVYGFIFDVNIDEVREQASKGSDPIRMWQFQILAADDARNPWKNMAKIKSSPRYVLTDEHRDWYLSWVQVCFENHPKCQRPSTMPTRLVDLGDDDKGTICLREDIKQISRYIALSHSWQFSEARNCMTVKDNYESRKRLLPQQGLSQTFHDAIKVARWLGVRYLWIDTFCIIQDDPDDWAQQASHMGDIFEGAYITIAVHCYQSSPPTDGCFLERKVIHEVALPDDTGDRFPVFIRPIFDAQGMVCARAPSLAPHPPFSAMGDICDYIYISMCEKELANFRHFSGPRQELDEDEFWYAWQDIVWVYSAADVTVPTDRLAALSSMVQRMPRQIFGDYLAGLWSKKLIEQLAWTTRAKFKYFRYQQYVAPSFSWASIYGGPVKVNFQLRPWNPVKQKACILDAGTVPAAHDPMGPVREGFIYMRLRVCEADVISLQRNTTEIDLRYNRKNGRPDSCRASVDTEDDMKDLEGQRVSLGEILNGSEFAEFLVMRKVADREGVFERVGTGTLYWKTRRDCDGLGIPRTRDRDPFCQVPEQEIRLV
ncbi:heterokaryon incompatibility protein-domain-containing protein [Aspergillus parasiticus]|uniref:Heterokaryon incompatibility protein-domain-containing protein n=1 Tax=Aspergillus parasiticus TaxID=5067 RepID=A0A5N6DTI4_ASPPA|nr:heterokaryon incompatibility protein-domain-containing protein [Aspergillus parasiticus]